MQILASFAEGLSVDIADAKAAAAADQQNKFDAKMTEELKKSPDKIADAKSEYKASDAKKIAQAMIKLMRALDKNPSETKLGQYSSSGDLAETAAALANVKEIMTTFDSNMKSGKYSSINLGLLDATYKWAKAHNKDINKAISCLFNPMSA